MGHGVGVLVIELGQLVVKDLVQVEFGGQFVAETIAFNQYFLSLIVGEFALHHDGAALDAILARLLNVVGQN